MNKFLIVIAVFLLSISASYAQTEKGSQNLGANLGFGYSDYNYTSSNSFANGSGVQSAKTTSFSFGPNYSYFIANDIDLGASVSGSSVTAKYDGQDISSFTKQSNYMFEGKVFLRKYFLYADKIGIRTGPYIGYSKSEQRAYFADPSGNIDGPYHTYEAGANLDLVYYPTKRLGVAAMLANLEYDHTSGKTVSPTTLDNEKGNAVNFSFINSGLTFSIFYVFGGKG